MKYIHSFVYLKPSHCLELFDKLVRPVLMYCAEVWGFHEGPDIERVHIKFCKMILRVKQSTPSDIVLGETRRVDIKTWRQIPIIKYWLKILNMSSNRHIYIYTTFIVY